MSYGTNVLNYLDFIPRQGGGQTRYYGVELETHPREVSGKAELIREIVRTKKALVKRDSSLGHEGFEIVTCPMDRANHHQFWVEMRESLKKCQSWGRKGYGIHIHVSRDSFSALTLAKALIFINSDKHNKKITTLAGRDGNTYAQFYKKGWKDYKDESDRYHAVNLQNDATVEFRLFQSATKPERILMYIEFVDCLLEWAKQESCQNIEQWDKFSAYAKRNRKDYPNLNHYLKSI